MQVLGLLNFDIPVVVVSIAGLPVPVPPVNSVCACKAFGIGGVFVDPMAVEEGGGGIGFVAGGDNCACTGSDSAVTGIVPTD